MWRRWAVAVLLSQVLTWGAFPGQARVMAPVRDPGMVAPGVTPAPVVSTADELRSESGQPPVARPQPKVEPPRPTTGVQPHPVPSRVPVLLYHHLDPAADGQNGAVVSVAEFEAQMLWLKQQGYTPLTTRQLEAWLSQRGTLPAQPVLITFDDGYRSNFVHAYPILERLGLKAVIFMVTGLAGERDGELEYLSWEELQAMERSGVIEVQGHTHDGHRKLEDGRPALVAWDAAGIRADLRQMRSSMEHGRLQPPTAYAYPFGAHDAETIESLRGEGVRLAFTVEPGFVQQGDGPYGLRRLIVYPGTSPCRFEGLVTGRRPPSCTG